MHQLAADQDEVACHMRGEKAKQSDEADSVDVAGGKTEADPQ
jgi:hypothetical protein